VNLCAGEKASLRGFTPVDWLVAQAVHCAFGFHFGMHASLCSKWLQVNELKPIPLD